MPVAVLSVAPSFRKRVFRISQPAGEYFRQYQVVYATGGRILDRHHGYEIRSLLHVSYIHSPAVLVGVADGQRQAVRIGFFLALFGNTFGNDAGEQGRCSGVL